jgi:anti-sigma regulatory factor (Ser/Thr protein kinase)
MTRSAPGPALVSELRIPAQAAFVMVAKRAASALGSTAGFSLEGIDDLNIAVAQACEKAIAAGDRLWGAGNGVLKLSFRIVDGGMEVEVRNLPARLSGADELAARREAELERRAESFRRTAQRLSQEVEVERRERQRAQREAQRLSSHARAELARAAPTDTSEIDLDDVAVNMIRLFVDELRYNVDSRGSMRMRMVKYLVD